MARTIQQIYDSIIGEKESNTTLNELQPNVSSYQSLLSDLTTQSKVAVWRTLFFVMAVAVWTVEKLFDEHKVWIEKRAKEIQVGSLSWYQTKALEFQYGDNLVWNPVTFQYEYPTEDKMTRIIKLASVTEINGTLLFKLAKLDSNNEPTPLEDQEVNPTDLPELGAFKVYIHQVKYAGVTVNCVSRPPDMLKLHLKVYYNAMLLDNNGALLTNPAVHPVDDAVKEYLKLIPFNGLFNVTSLIDAVQDVEGVVNPLLVDAKAKFGLQNWQPITDYYRANAGYMIVDTLTIDYVLP